MSLAAAVTFSYAPCASIRSIVPATIPGATWQAGVTPRSSELRPFINGEPAPLCFAANPRLGWALLYPVGKDGQIQAGERIVNGRVELRPCNE